MKRILMLLLLVMATMGANAQFRNGQALVCTGNNVNVRKGPGKNYGNIIWEYQGMNERAQLMKGDAVKYLGKKKNGFIYVRDLSVDYRFNFGDAWVSAQYFRAGKKCRHCGGDGLLGVCPECGGEGITVCCLGTGKVICEECGGDGYK